jgi:hypothetical protein
MTFKKTPVGDDSNSQLSHHLYHPTLEINFSRRVNPDTFPFVSLYFANVHAYQLDLRTHKGISDEATIMHFVLSSPNFVPSSLRIVPPPPRFLVIIYLQNEERQKKELATTARDKTFVPAARPCEHLWGRRGVHFTSERLTRNVYKLFQLIMYINNDINNDKTKTRKETAQKKDNLYHLRSLIESKEKTVQER